MAQSQVQVNKQEQALRQTQNFSQQQLLQAQLVELPLNQLLERINAEMDDNPALETASSEDIIDTEHDVYDDGGGSSDDTGGDDDFAAQSEREERMSALDEALSNIGRDDEDLPVYSGGRNQTEEREEIVYGESVSFYDLLKEQVAEIDIDDRRREIMEYLIGSLDDDGLLRKTADSIADELTIYRGMDVTEAEVEEVVGMLQDFDPPGIGARTLQECLLLQIARRPPSRLKDLMGEVVSRHFDDFTKKHWNRLQTALSLTEIQTETLIAELRRLNPKPGAAMGETVGQGMHQITPDFIVDTNDDGSVTFALNTGEIPELHVSQSFADTLKEYQDNKAGMSRQMKEALLYTKKKVEAAQGFIEAVKVRRRTLTVTMQAIIHWQHRFFEDGDEASLRPMILKDIAERTGLDISTISRVSNSKYAQTRWGTFPLRHFFSDSYVTESGEELSTRSIKAALKDIVDAEDKRRPLNDDSIRELLAAKGYPIARRTVAKYREQLGIPIARLRR
ncbi:MAG: RNA polymerase factor sigma-54 [Prevotella sp.]|nr:RNA polymerase factor sigma-54 [Prevotella sp.]